MNTTLTKEEQAIIKKAIANKTTGEIYSEDGLRLLKVLGNPEYVEVKDGVKAICDEALQGLDNLRDVVLPASVTPTWAKEPLQAVTVSSRLPCQE